MNKFPFGLICILFSASAVAVDVPQPADRESRVRVVLYDVNQVVKVNVSKGTATHIVLAPDEHIKDAAPGYGADCKSPEMDWCIVANKGDSHIFVKPKSGATTSNNLALVTDKRIYSFDFVLSKTPKNEDGRMFRVTFKYPEEVAKQKLALDARAIVEGRLGIPNKPRNWNYSMQALYGSSDIAPTMTFDDGRFMYLKFPNNREIPAIFAVAPDGSESLVNTHTENDIVVVHRVSRQLVLRLSKAVVGIWNDSYDPDGVPPHDGVTVDGVKRAVKGK